MLRKSKMPSMNIEEIKKYWEWVQSQSLKERLKLYRTVMQQAINLGQQENINAEDLKYCLDLMKECFLRLSYPLQAAQNKFNKLFFKYLSLIGVASSDIKILLKKSGLVDVSSGTITIKDKFYQDDLSKSQDFSQELLKLFNEGKEFIFSTHADGAYDVQVRVIDSPIPVLSVKEYLYAHESTPTQSIHFPTGELVVTDLGGPYLGLSYLKMKIPPGNYAVCVFAFVILKKEFFSYYIVLCKTDKKPEGQFQQIPELEL